MHFPCSVLVESKHSSVVLPFVVTSDNTSVPQGFEKDIRVFPQGLISPGLGKYLIENLVRSELALT